MKTVPMCSTLDCSGKHNVERELGLTDLWTLRCKPSFGVRYSIDTLADMFKREVIVSWTDNSEADGEAVFACKAGNMKWRGVEERPHGAEATELRLVGHVIGIPYLILVTRWINERKCMEK